MSPWRLPTTDRLANRGRASLRGAAKPGLAGSAFVVLLLAVGCNRAPPTGPGQRGVVATPVPDRAASLAKLRSAAHFQACRDELNALNQYFSHHPDEQPTGLSPAAADQLRQQFGLTEDELAEISPPRFTLLDAHHVDGCLLLHEAARSLGVDRLPPRERAEAGFAWAMRMVRWHPHDGPPLPSAFALRRGWGNALERAQVYIELLPQLGLDGCLVGTLEDEIFEMKAVGVRVGDDLLLFDAENGTPRLDAVGAPLTLRMQRQGREPAGQALVLTCSLSTLAPRQRFLEGQFGADASIKLGLDPEGLLKTYAQVALTPEHRSNELRPLPVRWLRAFLPPGMGGTDDQAQRLSQLERQVVPYEAITPAVRDLPGQPGQQLQARFARPFQELALDSGTGRDLIVRGRLGEAVRQLVTLREQLRRGRQQALDEPRLTEKMAEWSAEARDAYAALYRAERDPKADVEAARQRVNDLWNPDKALAPSLVIVNALADPLGAEITYLLALTKHEQAERACLAQPAPPAPEADWKAAADWWQVFLADYSSSPAAPAAALALARTLEMRGDRTAAIALLRDWENRVEGPRRSSFTHRLNRLQAN